MAAIDDSWDVHDYCVKMGLDPDRVSHLKRARDAMYAEARARNEASMTTQEREDRDARVARNVAAVSRINGLFKRRYGDYAEDESAPTLFAANDQSDGGSYNFPIKLQFECDHSAKCPTCEWVSEMYVNSTHAWVLGERPDDGVRTCGACGCHWRATEKCSHEKQKT